MGKLIRLIQGLSTIKGLGGGSFWLGSVYLVVGLIVLLFVALTLLPALIVAIVPDWLISLIGLALGLALIGGVIYIGAVGYNKARTIIDRVS